jgi:biopolymer transport protein TolR
MTSMATGGTRQYADINVTPLIDVLLVLLIIFMVVAPILPVGLQTQLPLPPDQDSAERPYDIVITLHRDGTLHLNQEAMKIAEFGSRLALIYQVRGNQVIFLRGDRDLEFRQIAQLIDLARGVGMSRVALMTMP